MNDTNNNFGVALALYLIMPFTGAWILLLCIFTPSDQEVNPNLLMMGLMFLIPFFIEISDGWLKKMVDH
jgi:hypothetical protein